MKNTFFFLLFWSVFLETPISFLSLNSLISNHYHKKWFWLYFHQMFQWSIEKRGRFVQSTPLSLRNFIEYPICCFSHDLFSWINTQFFYVDISNYKYYTSNQNFAEKKTFQISRNINLRKVREKNHFGKNQLGRLILTAFRSNFFSNFFKFINFVSFQKGWRQEVHKTTLTVNSDALHSLLNVLIQKLLNPLFLT